MPEQQLDGTDIRSLGQKVGGKGVAQRVDTGMLAYPRPFERLLERPLDRCLRSVPAQQLPRFGAWPHHAGWKHELPSDTAGCVGVLAVQRPGQGDVASPRQDILLVQRQYAKQVLLKSLLQRRGHQGGSVLRALAAS